jgi:hypothetical protein
MRGPAGVPDPARFRADIDCFASLVSACVDRLDTRPIYYPGINQGSNAIGTGSRASRRTAFDLAGAEGRGLAAQEHGGGLRAEEGLFATGLDVAHESAGFVVDGAAGGGAEPRAHRVLAWGVHKLG